MKKFYTLSFILLTALSFGQVTLPHYEGLDYTSGAALQTQTGWTLLNSGDDLAITTGSLSFPNLVASTGNKVGFGGGGIDAYKAFTAQTSGTVYYSLLLNVGSMTGVTDPNGGYIAGLAFDNTSFGGTLWTKRVDDTNFNIGIEVRTAVGALTTYTTGSYQTGKTYLIVVAYTFNTGGAADDVTKLWINPVPGDAEPTATLTDTHAGADLTNAGRFFLRQDSVTETPALEIDELRIGTTWAAVTPKAPLGVKANLIAGLNVYPNPVKDGNLYITSNSSEAKTVSVYDILGKQVLNAKTSNNAVNVSSLKGGAYIVKITEEGKTYTRKLIIQ